MFSGCYCSTLLFSTYFCIYLWFVLKDADKPISLRGCIQKASLHFLCLQQHTQQGTYRGQRSINYAVCGLCFAQKSRHSVLQNNHLHESNAISKCVIISKIKKKANYLDLLRSGKAMGNSLLWTSGFNLLVSFLCPQLPPQLSKLLLNLGSGAARKMFGCLVWGAMEEAGSTPMDLLLNSASSG